MNKVRELNIHSTLWATPAKIINLLDFKPEKLSIKTENDESSIKVHQLRYENGGFYLTIDNIKGYFSFSNNNTVLSDMIFSDDQENKYHQVWKEIFKIVDNENGELNLHEKIVLSDSDIPTDKIIKIPSVTIVIKSLLKKKKNLFRTFTKSFILQIIKILEYNRIDISEGIDFNKCEETSKKCSLCKFYYFLDKNFSYGPFLCIGCYDMSLKAVRMQNLAIINHNGNHYRVNFTFVSKKDAYNLIKNATIIDKKGTL